MGIRCSAKAIVVHKGQVLLNRNDNGRGGACYTLPGGGQRQYETLHQAVVREVLEETGYTVEPVRFAALFEEIFLDEQLRAEYPDYAHRIYHIFLCALADVPRQPPTEPDWTQTGSEWVETAALGSLRILPKTVGDALPRMLGSDAPLFLGSEHVQYNHP